MGLSCTSNLCSSFPSFLYSMYHMITEFSGRLISASSSVFLVSTSSVANVCCRNLSISPPLNAVVSMLTGYPFRKAILKLVWHWLKSVTSANGHIIQFTRRIFSTVVIPNIWAHKALMIPMANILPIVSSFIHLLTPHRCQVVWWSAPQDQVFAKVYIVLVYPFVAAVAKG